MFLFFVCTFRTEEASPEQEGFAVDKCVICQEGFGESSPPVNVYEKGLKAMIKLSREWETSTLHAYLLEMTQCDGRVIVYHSCWRKLTDTRKKT